MNAAQLGSWMTDRAGEVEGWLSLFIESSKIRRDVPAGLTEAMAYSLTAGGKRLRPALVIAAAEACGEEGAGRAGERPRLLRDACCAIEMIHTYSLIHDDLPAMDDDDLRRGRPTSHKVFGEAMAILAGDALLTDAFSVLASGLCPGREPPVDAAEEGSRRLSLAALLAGAAGSHGMVGGQVMDVSRMAAGEGVERVEAVHELKTGALFEYSCGAGGIVAGADDDLVSRLRVFGRKVGVAFQIADDILDEVGEAEAMGKRVGKDRERDTATVTRALGLDGARARARALVDDAAETIEDLGSRAAPLRALAERLVVRTS